MPSVFISYSHDSPAHRDSILALSDRLRAEGVDCRIDQYEQSPPEGWPRWCDRLVEESAFVLVVCTEIYPRRFKGEEVPRVGLGVTWEGHIITQELYNAQGLNAKFIPVMLSKEDARFVPVPLQSATRYPLPDDYEGLYRRLTNQPLVTMPDLGKVKPMPGLERKQDFQAMAGASSQEPILHWTRKNIQGFGAGAGTAKERCAERSWRRRQNADRGRVRL